MWPWSFKKIFPTADNSPTPLFVAPIRQNGNVCCFHFTPFSHSPYLLSIHKFFLALRTWVIDIFPQFIMNEYALIGHSQAIFHSQVEKNEKTAKAGILFSTGPFTD